MAETAFLRLSRLGEVANRRGVCKFLWLVLVNGQSLLSKAEQPIGTKPMSSISSVSSNWLQSVSAGGNWLQSAVAPSSSNDWIDAANTSDPVAAAASAIAAAEEAGASGSSSNAVNTGIAAAEQELMGYTVTSGTPSTTTNAVDILA
jgi:hypothetical protein